MPVRIPDTALPIAEVWEKSGIPRRIGKTIRGVPSTSPQVTMKETTSPVERPVAEGIEIPGDAQMAARLQEQEYAEAVPEVPRTGGASSSSAAPPTSPTWAASMAASGFGPATGLTSTAPV